MEIGDATELVHDIAAAWPLDWQRTPVKTTELWVRFLATLNRVDIARQTLQALVETEARIPAIALFRGDYLGRVKRALEQAPLPAIPEEAGETPLPAGPAEWERLGAVHRELRRRRFSESEDPAAGKPLPRARVEFNREWAVFLRVRYESDDVARAELLRSM